MLKEISKIYIREGYEPFYHQVLSQAFKLDANSESGSRRQIFQEIKDYNIKIERARNLVISGEFTNVDFRVVKKECESKITALGSRLPELAVSAQNVDLIMTGALSNLKTLSTVYKSGNMEKMRGIIGSTYPENLQFDGTECRTARGNEIVNAISLINKKLGAKKTG
jgi:site-specific DNA recombinase